MNELDRSSAVLASDLEGLSSRGRAAFFAACGQSLRPLYDDFVARHSWGEVGVLDEALEVAERFARGDETGPQPQLLARLEAATPHGDDFDHPDSTYAQDAVICADAAVRCAIGENLDLRSVYYALEPLVTELGEDDDCDSEDDRLNRIFGHPEMQRALGFCRSAVATLAGRDVVDDCAMSWLANSADVLLPDGFERPEQTPAAGE